MIYCIRKKFKASILFHKILLLGESGWAFTALKFGINRCNEPLKLFFN
nr:MAG TPA: hypothetical protein [Caudoviricetes sp.]